jgi:hypothetical protein
MSQVTQGSGPGCHRAQQVQGHVHTAAVVHSGQLPGFDASAVQGAVYALCVLRCRGAAIWCCQDGSRVGEACRGGGEVVLSASLP